MEIEVEWDEPTKRMITQEEHDIDREFEEIGNTYWLIDISALNRME